MTGQIIGTWCGHPVTEIGTQLCDKCESEMSLSQIINTIGTWSVSELDNLTDSLNSLLAKREKNV